MTFGSHPQLVDQPDFSRLREAIQPTRCGHGVFTVSPLAGGDPSWHGNAAYHAAEQSGGPHPGAGVLRPAGAAATAAGRTPAEGVPRMAADEGQRGAASEWEITARRP